MVVLWKHFFPSYFFNVTSLSVMWHLLCGKWSWIKLCSQFMARSKSVDIIHVSCVSDMPWYIYLWGQFNSVIKRAFRMLSWTAIMKVQYLKRASQKSRWVPEWYYGRFLTASSLTPTNFSPWGIPCPESDLQLARMELSGRAWGRGQWGPGPEPCHGASDLMLWEMEGWLCLCSLTSVWLTWPLTPV